LKIVSTFCDHSNVLHIKEIVDESSFSILLYDLIKSVAFDQVVVFVLQWEIPVFEADSKRKRGMNRLENCHYRDVSLKMNETRLSVSFERNLKSLLSSFASRNGKQFNEVESLVIRHYTENRYTEILSRIVTKEALESVSPCECAILLRVKPSYSLLYLDEIINPDQQHFHCSNAFSSRGKYDEYLFLQNIAENSVTSSVLFSVVQDSNNNRKWMPSCCI
jgi:hypothetical protein